VSLVYVEKHYAKNSYCVQIYTYLYLRRQVAHFLCC